MNRGGFYCPICEKLNMCNCSTCSDIPLLDGEKIVIIHDKKNDETMTCAYCDTVFSYDDALDTEWIINVANDEVDRSLLLFKDSLKDKIEIENYKIMIDDILVEIEDKCKNEASKQTYLMKLQEVLYYGHRLELMIYFKGSID